MKILIVEDDYVVARYLQEILLDEGYKLIQHSTNVEDALKVIQSQKPSLVLMDINLGRSKDGIDLALDLLVKDNFPYIFITSYSDKLTIERIKETRPHGIIIKPFKAADIKTNVAVVLNNYRYKNIDVTRAKDTTNQDAPLRIKDVVRYIDDHISEKIDIDTLVPLTKWKKHHMIRMFSQFMGTTPYSYILNRKIEKSKLLLEATDLPVSAVAADMGFYSPSNFCATFKKFTGLSPEAYRKQYWIKSKTT
ncbi:response regulator transcription factor [Flavobacterium album]|uniref:response regulator transcription factor n=1 Tax=Flavobacterium album TaxID=2175091 RepID=UPI0015E7EBE8|nr:response regulator transcription factor [Flavobacterium album]